MRAAMILGFTVLSMSCAGDDGGSAQSGSSESSGTAATSVSTMSTSVDPTALDGSTSPGESGSTATVGGDASTTSTSTDDTVDESSDATGTPGLDANGCPGDAPDSWISCESFDAIDDPATQIAEWDVVGDAFGVDPDPADPSDRMLRITLTPGLMFGGWVTLRWGTGPDGPGVDSPEGSWDDVWVRYEFRTADDWPGYALGDLGEVIAMNGPNWAIATEIAIRGDGSQQLRPLGWSCISGGTLNCDGNNDWSGGLQLIFQEAGASTIFGAGSAGQWQCVEAHMRLNAPGASDGELQIWVDGNEEVSRTGIDWRGTWDDYGLNALRFTNYANPPPQPLDFFVDDVVVATERVGCR